jgi:plastocyanin
LTASGVPNDNGRIRWPIGLKILGRTVSDDLGEQLNALYLIAAAEAANGQVSANVSSQIKKNLEEFRHRVFKDRNDRLGLPLRVYDEAERFLDKLTDAEKVLRAGLGNAVEAELKPASTPAAASSQGKRTEVRVQDNRFDPQKITIAAGTTIEWIHGGQHHHTVTSDEGLWSAQLSPGGRYSQRFERPGTYSYHCELHPQAMRGVIEVK